MRVLVLVIKNLDLGVIKNGFFRKDKTNMGGGD